MDITIFSFIIVCVFFVIVIEAVRRGIFETKDSLIWIFTCIVLGVLSLSPGLLNFLAKFLGIVYAPSLLFLFGLLCTIIMIFDLTKRISKLNNKVILLTQELSLLKQDYQKHLNKTSKQRKENA
ncbi:DUF2304 domain-containing protein [Virgibacillus pantothenticus]|uniref:DUF2304 domain-containing protein n=1 Tax=Virgibacillus pantothenticus TaxID=1473 RepID=UPI003D26AF3D